MSRLKNLLRFASLTLVAIALTTPFTSSVLPSAPPAQGVRLTPIGAPTWAPIDFHLFSAPLGTAASGYVEFVETSLGLLPEPTHTFHPQLVVGPGAPHSPPYGGELAAGVAAKGYRQGVRFNAREFSEGMGIYLVAMIVPSPGSTGSSPDFGAGPIIANTLFPIQVEGTNWHNAKPFSFLGAFAVPPLDQDLDPPFAVDGHSHFPMFFADNADFGPPGAKLNGSYVFRITMIDQTGQGWRIEAHFAVGP